MTSPLPRLDASEAVYRILLIEDDVADAPLVEELLHDTGLPFELITSSSLAEAPTVLTTRDINCILLDPHLPDVAGPDAVTTVHHLAPHTAVIVLTGTSETQAGAEAMAAGAQDHLVKGRVEAEALRRTVRYAVYRGHAERADAEARSARLRAEENARLERGLLPRPLLDTSAVTVTTRYLPGAEQPSSAVTSSTWSRATTDCCRPSSATSADTAPTPPHSASVCASPGAPSSWADTAARACCTSWNVSSSPSADRGPIFATCALLTLDLKTATAALHLAGHHEPLLTTGGETREVAAEHGITLGLTPHHRDWPATVVDLPRAGALTLYTDGLTEGHNGEAPGRLGTQGLLALVATTPAADPATHLDGLIRRSRALDAGRHTDDLAVLRLDWGD